MSPAKETINLITLGCSKNTVDSEFLLRQLSANGWDLSETSDGSEIAIINTCGFIESAKQESIETILRAVALKNEGRLRKVIVMGCLSERYAAELKAEIPEVDAFIGANTIDKVVAALGGSMKHELLGERMLTTPQHFAYLKISEGCDRPCSFCSIPLMRGRHKSKPAARVLLEARRLAALGVRELILIAQDTTFYGLDLEGKRTLPHLLESLAQVDGIDWIRLMYAFPTGFPEDLLRQFRSNPKLCRYLDMPVQHVSDTVLTSMRRGITSVKLRALIDRIRAAVPEIALRTTLIVGYPTEGEKEFEELLEFVGQTRFDRLGVFAYSQEEGTSAYPLGDPVPAEVKEDRRRRIMELQGSISRAKNQERVGQTLRVLVDRQEGDQVVIGRTESDAPEVDNEIAIRTTATSRLSIGRFYPVTVVDAEDYDLFAIPAAGAPEAVLEAP